MYAIMDFIFKNIILIIVIILLILIYKQYKDLKKDSIQITDIFDKVLNNYLISKIKEAEQTTASIKEKYKDNDEVKTEIDRLLITIDKGANGRINDKVECSNAINKYKPNKNIDLEKYPELADLTKLGTFTEEDMGSLNNGIAIARRDYNALAFKYNEKSSAFPIQYLTKVLGLSPYYVIFDAPKSQAYAEKFEVFEEEEPVIDTISSLNQSTTNNDDLFINSLNMMNRVEPSTPEPEESASNDNENNINENEDNQKSDVNETSES